jgi:hypothetical protein
VYVQRIYLILCIDCTKFEIAAEVTFVCCKSINVGTCECITCRYVQTKENMTSMCGKILVVSIPA